MFPNMMEGKIIFSFFTIVQGWGRTARNRNRPAQILGFMLFAASAGGSIAAPYAWTTGGPYGGDANDIVVDPRNPDLLYVSTRQAGILRSADGGLSWWRINQGFDTPDGGITVFDLAIAPEDSNVIYAASPWAPGGLFKTVDGGASWTNISASFGSLPVWDIALDPQRPGRIYAAVTDPSTGQGYVGVSTDGGGSWRRSVVGSLGNLVRDVAVDEFHPLIVYAGTVNAGVFRSIDGGRSWVAVDSGLPAQPIVDLVTDPHRALTIYAIVNREGVFRSRDAGATWTRITSSLPTKRFGALVVDPVTPDTLYVSTTATFEADRWGIYKSSDGGASWTRLQANGLTSFYPYALTIDPRDPAVIYVATHGETVFKSTDGGQNFAFRSEGINAVFNWSVVTDPNTPGAVYSGTHDRFCKSTDGGQSWSLIKLSPTAAFIYDVAVDPQRPNVIYVACGHNAAGRTEAGRGIYRSTDYGETWTLQVEGMVDANPIQVEINPRFPNIVYAGGANGQFYKSDNYGESWVAKDLGVGNAFVLDIVIHPDDPRTLFVALDNGAVRMSRDAGETWRGDALVPGSPVKSLALDVVDSVLYAGVGGSVGGLYRMDMTLSGWTPVFNDFVGRAVVEEIHIDPADPDVIYLGIAPVEGSTQPYASGIYKSVDRGASWESITGDIEHRAVVGIASDPFVPGKIYAATLGGSVFQSSGPAATQEVPSETPSK